MSLTWYCALIEPGRDAVATRALEPIPVTVYAPIEKRMLIRRQRRVESLRPLLPGYLFFGTGGENVFGRVTEATGVLRILSLASDGSPQVIPWSALSALQTVEAELEEAFQRRWRRSHKVRRRGRTDDLIAALKRVQPEERGAVLLDFIAEKEEAVTLKLGDLRVLNGG